jgi:phospholipase D-like protein
MSVMVTAEAPHFSNVVVATGIGALVLLPLIFFVAALVSILANPQSGGMKIVWIVFAFCAPFLGPLLWFVVGRRQAVRS